MYIYQLSLVSKMVQCCITAVPCPVLHHLRSHAVVGWEARGLWTCDVGMPSCHSCDLCHVLFANVVSCQLGKAAAWSHDVRRWQFQRQVWHGHCEGAWKTRLQARTTSMPCGFKLDSVGYGILWCVVRHHCIVVLCCSWLSTSKKFD